MENIIPIHKKGAKTDPVNYILVSLLPFIISKVMEVIIAANIMSFLFFKQPDLS